MNLKDKTIILGVTGGIGAYKAIELTRLLTKAGADVWPVMTDSAMEFIGPLSLETLSGNPVSTSLFKANDTGRINHIELAEKADLVIIAPATANTIGKVAGGIADDILSTLILATTAEVLIAPAMNNHMYDNKAVQANIEKLIGFGYSFVGPAEGELACGSEGRGRLAPIEEIMDKAMEILSSKDLTGETVLVTAGATREEIDPVRFLSNGSSGKMGFALARAALRRGAKV
ncbi:MAG: bifunctional phosphopantothenoylcysteine decarboxylase/phosphopantothenate--cysteine ligase CoaBC, partial [Proteobacteria bacterium]|nr:bifunctional phosphopantothenoylcysteine decarboxylase/phosphopantothenate--cysteine ligase CoaBC [Pseudomonadota bacterium]